MHETNYTTKLTDKFGITAVIETAMKSEFQHGFIIVRSQNLKRFKLEHFTVYIAYLASFEEKGYILIPRNPHLVSEHILSFIEEPIV